MLEPWGKKEIETFHRNAYLQNFKGELCARLIVKRSKPYIGVNVLDLGAGSGALIALIPNAVGVDLIARPERNVKKGDITALEFRDAQFDTVFCTEVLEHLNDEDLERCLREIYRVLKKGGRLIITVPYRENLSLQIIRCPFCGREYHRWGHQRSFDKQEMKNLLENFGFKHHLKTEVIPLQSMAKHAFLSPMIKIVSRFIDKWQNSMNLFLITEK